MEVRGIGIVDLPTAGEAPVALLIDLFDTIDRMPLDMRRRTLAGIDVPVARIAAFEISAPIKVELALKALGLNDAGPA